MADTMTAPSNFIAGEWRPSAAGNTYEKHNPARPDEVVGEFPSSTREDVETSPSRPPTTRARAGPAPRSPSAPRSSPPPPR